MKINDENQGKNNIFLKQGKRQEKQQGQRSKGRGGQTPSTPPTLTKQRDTYFFILRIRFMKRREGLETAFISDEDVEPSKS